MRTSSFSWFIGFVLLGCSAEHTIANDANSAQTMQVIARPVCVAMCEYSLDCGQIAESELGDCLNQCQANCTRLESLIPERMYNTNGIQYTASAADVIASVSTCYLASACATALQPMCHPNDIGSYADTLEGKPNATLNGTMGLTSCSMREDALTCDSTIAQDRNKAEAWSLTCERTDVAATEWTCDCVEYGAHVATVTGTPAEDDPAFLELCWTAAQLSCFYAGQRTDCGMSSAGDGLE